MTIIHKTIDAARNHPAYLLALGISPLIIKSQSTLSAITVSVAYLLILLLSSISVSALRRFTPQQTHLVFILIITSTWTTVIDLLMQVWFYEMRLLMDIYIPIIAMNSLLLMFLQTEALQYPVSKIITRLLLPVGLVILLCVITGATREILAYGQVFSDSELLIPSMSGASFRLIPDTMVLPLFNKVAGGFMVLGCVIALLNLMLQKYKIASAAYLGQ